MASPDAAQSGVFKIGGTLAVNRLGFGAMRITGKGIWGEPADRAEALRTLHRLPTLGVNFIDTADSYGPDVSEKLLHEALHPYKGLVIATKGGLLRPGPDHWVPQGRPDYLIAQARKSLDKLGVAHIDLWQLHRIDPKVPRDEQFGAIKSLLDDGLIRHAGLSEVSVAEVEAASKVFKVATVQNRYNLGDRSSEADPGVLRKARHRLHPVVPAGRRRAGPSGDPARRDRQGPWCDTGPDRAGLGAEAQPGDAADPGDIESGASGGECRGRGDCADGCGVCRAGSVREVGGTVGSASNLNEFQSWPGLSRPSIEPTPGSHCYRVSGVGPTWIPGTSPGMTFFLYRPPNTVLPKRSRYFDGLLRQYCGGASTEAPSSAAACQPQRGS